MISYDWNNATAILNFGLETQKDIADLNDVASEIIKKRNYDDLMQAFRALLLLAEEEGDISLAEKEEHLEELQKKMIQMRIELVKEGKLLLELRNTNECYVNRISEEIEAGRERLKSDADLNDVLEKRIRELMTSKTVAESFSAQLKYAMDNSNAMADRLWEALMTLLPLMRGRISLKTNQTMIEETQKTIKKWLKDIEVAKAN